MEETGNKKIRHWICDNCDTINSWAFKSCVDCGFQKTNQLTPMKPSCAVAEAASMTNEERMRRSVEMLRSEPIAVRTIPQFSHRCVCGKRFLTSSAFQKYCSRKCNQEDRPLVSKECDWCGKAMIIRTLKAQDQKHHFCSRSCSQKFSYGRKKPFYRSR